MKRKDWTMAWILVCAVLWVGIDLFHQWSASHEDPHQLVLATVGDRKITVANFEDYFYSLPANSQRMYSAQDLRRYVLAAQIENQLLPVVAESLGISKEPQVIAEIARSEKTADAASKPKQRDMILTRVLMERISKSELVVTDAHVRRYFSFSANRFKNAYIVEASRIILPTLQDVASAQKKLAKGKSFDEVAMAMSMEPGAAFWHGWMPQMLVSRESSKPVGRILLMMKPGQITNPIPENPGYGLYKLRAIIPATLETARRMIEVELQEDKFKDWKERQKIKVGVQQDDKLLAAINLRA